MIKLDVLKVYADEYKMRNLVLKKWMKEKMDFEIANSDGITKYNEKLKTISDKEEEVKYIDDNEILWSYDHFCWRVAKSQDSVNELLNGDFNGQNCLNVSTSNYVALKHNKDEDYDLVNLNEQEIINMSKLSGIEKEFTIKLLKYQKSFVGYITRSELPLLMYLLEKGITDAKELGLELKKAQMTDRKEIETTFIDPITNEREVVHNELPFVYNSRILEDMWYRLDEESKILSDEEYFIKYYEYLILFGNNIENIYFEAPDEYKGYMIEAYYRLTQTMTCPWDKEKDVHYVTTSSLINEELLKRKYAKIK